MATGTRKQREKQEGIWIAQAEMASAPAHPFYQKLNELLEGEEFDEFVEERCAKFYAPKYEVDTMARVLARRFPRNSLLSHDLIEGAYARAGLATDIVVIR
jgi:hypothetical protein